MDSAEGEICVECKQLISGQETPHLWEEKIVCENCFKSLQTMRQMRISENAVRPATANLASSSPALKMDRWTLVLSGFIGVLIVAATIYLANTTIRVTVVPDPSEPTYQGRGFSSWLRLIRDKDYETSSEAVIVLRRFYGDKQRAAIVKAIDSSNASLDELITLHMALESEDAKSACADKMAKEISDRQYLMAKEVDALRWLHPAPKQILPALEKLKDQDPELKNLISQLRGN